MKEDELKAVEEREATKDETALAEHLGVSPEYVHERPGGLLEVDLPNPNDSDNGTWLWHDMSYRDDSTGWNLVHDGQWRQLVDIEGY